MKGMALVAICAALATIQIEIAAPILFVINVLIAPHLIMRTYRGNRRERAFCIGLLAPLSGLIILTVGYVHLYMFFEGGGEPLLQAYQSAIKNLPGFRTHALVTWGVALLSGAICWFVAWREQGQDA